MSEFRFTFNAALEVRFEKVSRKDANYFVGLQLKLVRGGG